MSLHQCFELKEETITKYDKDVLAFITKEYKLLKHLGSGKFGHVFLLSRGKDEEIAMKIMPCNSTSESEIRTACLLNNIRTDTGIFTHTFGWLSCSEFPKHFFEYIEPDKRPDPDLTFIYMFSEFVPYAWNDKSFYYSDKDYRILFFLLLHGIYVARKELHFFHHDIHDGNIMLRSIFHTETVAVKTSLLEYEISGARFVPKLIDYGEANAKPISTVNKGKVSDLKMLSMEFFRMMTEQDNREARRAFLKLTNPIDFENACKTDASNYEVIEHMLNHSYFDIPEIKRIDRPEKRNKTTNRCISCTTAANVEFENTGLHFCSRTCARKSQRIVSLIKF